MSVILHDNYKYPDLLLGDMRTWKLDDVPHPKRYDENGDLVYVDFDALKKYNAVKLEK